MSFFDLDTEAGARAGRQMTDDLVGWITTVFRDGTPRSSVVAYLWDGETITVFSDPDAMKVRNLIENHRCSFHLNTDEHGLSVVTIEGTVAVEPGGPRWNEIPAFVEKYRAAFEVWGMDIEEGAAAYSQRLTITPVSVRVQ